MKTTTELASSVADAVNSSLGLSEGPTDDWLEKFASLFLAASQAREQQLREALERNEREIYHLRADRGWTNQSEFRPSEILALPTDDTALQARLKEERERCAVECEQHGPTIGRIFASKIRSMK